ncbi:hypothetical protein ABH931_006993 [Streptacidiphilus sp. MAP12-33]|uniref:hypothetical protein n=1 Tax=Streptacidiphilus sp. MAP12-33 TaxID=3156266 RepID=UPI0035159DED
MITHDTPELDTIPPHLRALLTADERRLRSRRQLIAGLTVFLALLATLIAIAAVDASRDPAFTTSGAHGLTAIHFLADV